MLHRVLEEQMRFVQGVLSSRVVRRDKEEELRKWKDSDLIKAVLGPRRSGKSFLTILTLGEEAAYINFDDERLLKWEIDEILEAAFDVYGNVSYVILDEVHNLENWPLILERLRRRGLNLFITGSNSKLLEKELSSRLTGRIKTVELLPFNYREFLRAKEEGPSLKSFTRFLETSGYPEVVVKGYDLEYVEELIKMAVSTDVIARHRIRDVKTLRALAAFLYYHAGKPISLRNLAEEAGVSVHTVKRYVSLLEEGYTLFSLKSYSRKAKKRLGLPSKYYPPDHGIANVYGAGKGQVLENVVFLALKGIWDGEMYYVREQDYEVDFFLVRGEKKIAIQVSYKLERDNVRRELKALERVKRFGARTLLLSLYNETDVEAVPVWEFLSKPEAYIS
ncbi:MAG: ATP-binding protein [Candidatus Diapherotrites archaeon]|nr:ATP-binding protein [Candidatus Diapherotrites archaeon]